MASNASSDVEGEEETLSSATKKTGRAAECPDFAIIWSYLENFQELLHFPEISLDTLEDAFNSTSRTNGEQFVIFDMSRCKSSWLFDNFHVFV